MLLQPPLYTRSDTAVPCLHHVCYTPLCLCSLCFPSLKHSSQPCLLGDYLLNTQGTVHKSSQDGNLSCDVTQQYSIQTFCKNFHTTSLHLFVSIIVYWCLIWQSLITELFPPHLFPLPHLWIFVSLMPKKNSGNSRCMINVGGMSEYIYDKFILKSEDKFKFYNNKLNYQSVRVNYV